MQDLAMSPAAPQPSSAMMPEPKKQLSRRTLSVIDMLVGLIFIVGVPMAFYSWPVNYNDVAIGVVFGLVILGVAYMNFRGSKSMKRSMVPYVLLLLGLISIFLFSYTFDTPWVATYHLYIFPIDFGGPSNMFYIPGSHGEYVVQDYLAETSTMGGIILLLSSLYDISLNRKIPKA
jgi:hypothetical protein